MLNYLDNFFNFFISLGGPAMMLIVLTILALLFKSSFTKAIEGGFRMAVALTGMGAIISLLTSTFAPTLNKFVSSTGIQLSITDLGWAPLSLITWGSVYTLYFAFICISLNLILLFFKLTNTLNVDLFNIWNISILGLLTKYYSNSMLLTSLFVLFVYTFMLLNADVMKSKINKILGYNENNITTTAHPCFLIAPVVMVINKLIDLVFPFIDKFDFDAETLNKKIGFFGSKFAIGAYLGIFIGILGKESISTVFNLAFTGGVALELFSLVGGWFGPAIEPLSNGVQNFMKKKMQTRKLLIAIDWPIVASRAELWAVVNILAPILLIISMVLPYNKVLPLGGILLTVLVPALLIVTEGKVIRMTIIGTILIPIYLWAATLIAKFVTSSSIAMNNFPKGLQADQLFSSIDSNPIEKMLAILLGKGYYEVNFTYLVSAIVFILIYIMIFSWYRKQISKYN